LDIAAVAKSDAVRQVELRDWGKAILEELLLRAAEQVSDAGAAPGSVTLALTFELTPDAHERTIEISTPGAVERAIVTCLPLPD
jgi:hypothetical protein